MKKLISKIHPHMSGLLLLLLCIAPAFIEAQPEMYVNSFVQLVDTDNLRSKLSQPFNFHTFKFSDTAITEGPTLQVYGNKIYQLNLSFSYDMQDSAQTTEMEDYLQQGGSIRVEKSAKKVFETLKVTKLADKFSISVRVLGTPTSQEPLRIHLLDKQQQSIAYVDYTLYVRSTAASATSTVTFLKTHPPLHLRFKKTTTQIRYGYFDLTTNAKPILTLALKYGDTYDLLLNLTEAIGVEKKHKIVADHKHAYGYRVEYESPDKWLMVKASGDGDLKGILSVRTPNPKVMLAYRDKNSFGERTLHIKLFRGNGSQPIGTYSIKFQVMK